MSPAVTVRAAEDPADREACFAVRKEVFVAEQGVPEDIEYDAHDADAVHLLALDADGTPSARPGCCTAPPPRRRTAATRPSAPSAASRC